MLLYLEVTKALRLLKKCKPKVFTSNRSEQVYLQNLRESSYKRKGNICLKKTWKKSGEK